MKLALLVASAATCNAFIRQPLRTSRQPTAVGPRGTLTMALPTADDIATTEFMQSFELAAQVCDGLLEADADAAALVPAFMTTSDAARGWFVTSLTTPEYRDAALHPSVVEAVVQQPAEQDPVTRLMIMNVIMPLATAMQHESMGNADQAASSLETFDRAQNLIKKVAESGPSSAKERLKQDVTAIAAASTIAEAGWEGKDDEGEEEDSDVGRLKFWLKFMDKWQYQPAQKQVIRQIADGLLQAELK